MNNNQNTNIATTTLEGIYGMSMSRSDIEDRLIQDPGWLKSIGGIVHVNRDMAFVIPGAELSFASLQRLDQIGLPRLINNVVSRTGGYVPQFSTPVHKDWRRTYAMINLSKLNFEDGHYVRNFEPEYNGTIVAYHGVKTEGVYTDREFTSVKGQAIRRFDYLAHKGKNYMAAITINPETQLRTVFTRETPIKAILHGESVSTGWTPAPWAKDHKVVGLRGVIENDKVGYGFRNPTTNIFYTATPESKEATLRRKDVKGVLINVTGAMDLPLTTLLTEGNEVHAVDLFGKKDVVILDLSNEEYRETAQKMSESTSFIGTISEDDVWLQGDAPHAGLLHVSRPTQLAQIAA